MLRFSRPEQQAIKDMLAFCETRVRGYSSVELQPHTDSAYIYYVLIDKEPLFCSYLDQFMHARGVATARRKTISTFVLSRMAKRTPESIEAFRYSLEKHKHKTTLERVHEALKDYALLSSIGYKGNGV